MNTEIIKSKVLQSFRCVLNDESLYLLLTKSSFDIFLCGGFVRNVILGINNSFNDIDLFFQCKDYELSFFVKEISNYGEVKLGPFGAPRLFLKDKKIGYIDIVPFSCFKVSKNPISDINQLLENFDFTANAIGLSLKEKILYDPLNALSDIDNKILRAVRLDFPDKKVALNISLSTLSVFWFRLLTYQYKLDFNFDENTYRWICQNKFRYDDLKLFEEYFFKPEFSRSILKEMNLA